jgi:hypothetical protein
MMKLYVRMEVVSGKYFPREACDDCSTVRSICCSIPHWYRTTLDVSSYSVDVNGKTDSSWGQRGTGGRE